MNNLLKHLTTELEEKIKKEGYVDGEGNPILLETLVRKEPEWAANVIRSLKEKVKHWEKK